MSSGAQGVFSWFTILEQILENVIRPVQHALKECIVSAIKQFGDPWCVLITISISLTQTSYVGDKQKSQVAKNCKCRNLLGINLTY